MFIHKIEAFCINFDDSKMQLIRPIFFVYQDLKEKIILRKNNTIYPPNNYQIQRIVYMTQG